MKFLASGLVLAISDAAVLPDSTTGSVIQVGDECVIQQKSQQHILGWGRCVDFAGHAIAPDWEFVSKESKAYGQIRMRTGHGMYSGSCWTMESTERDAPVSLKECDDQNIGQLFTVKNKQIWSVVSPDPTVEKLAYCVVYERSGTLRTRRCYSTEMGELYTRVYTGTQSPVTSASAETTTVSSPTLTSVSPISTPSVEQRLLIRLIERLR